jgi:galactokinase/mevalonate kinase-like predicted kinase
MFCIICNKKLTVGSDCIKKFMINNELLKDFKYELLKGDIDNCGRILAESWQIKKKFIGVRQ